MSTNKADGDAGARRASAVISTALCSELSVASLSEDWAKVDIKFSYRNSFDNNKLITHHCQVKSGLSYKAKSSNTKVITLQNINKDTLNALSDSCALIVWVPPKPSSKIFWHVIDPRSPIKTPIKIPRTQFVRPSIRYDLSRVIAYSKWSRSVARQEVATKHDDNQITARAKSEYKKLIHTSWPNPLVGDLNITRFAWRHVTRRAKVKKRRIFSLSIVPYLKAFLSETPDRYTISAPVFRIEGKKTTETRYLLCWYRGVLKIGTRHYSLLLRIKEEVTYPTKWEKYPLGVNDIKQTATLASWWAKEDK